MLAKLHSLTLPIKLTGWKRYYTVNAVTLALRKKRYEVDGKKYRVKQLDGGWNLNYPRTIKMVIEGDKIVAKIGLGAAQGKISDAEYDFGATVIRLFDQAQTALTEGKECDLTEALTWVPEILGVSKDDERVKVVAVLSSTFELLIIDYLYRIKSKAG